MRPRRRFALALLALAGLLLSSVEQAWALGCAPEPGGQARAESPAAGSAMPGHEAGAHHGERQPGPEQPAPASCPMQAAATCAPAPLPVLSSGDWTVPPAGPEGLPAFHDRLPHLLFVSSLFRPPQA